MPRVGQTFFMTITETLHNDLVTNQLWIALACDVFEYQGKIYLIVVDHYSKFIVVEPVADHSAKKTINAFLQISSKLGIPTTIPCDHSANFTSKMFIAFCSNLDISLSYSSSIHLSSNPVERTVRTVKNIVKKCSDNNLGSSAWKIGLLEYQCTPISDSIPSPAELLKKQVLQMFSAFSQTFIKLISGYKRQSDRQPDLLEREGKDES